MITRQINISQFAVIKDEYPKATESVNRRSIAFVSVRMGKEVAKAIYALNGIFVDSMRVKVMKANSGWTRKE